MLRILLLLFLSHFVPLFAQQHNTIDSLLLELQKEFPDSTKALIHSQIGSELLNENPFKAEQHWNQSLVLINKELQKKNQSNRNDLLGIKFSSYNGLAIIASQRGNAPDALNYYQQILSSSDSLIDEKGRATIYHNIGLMYSRTKDYKKAIAYLKQAETLRATFKLWKPLCNTLNSIGIAYRKKENADSAYYYYHKILEISKKYQLKTAPIKAINGLAVLKHKAGDLDSALVLYLRARELLKERGRKLNIATNQLNIAQVLYKQKKYNAAKKEVLVAISSAKERRNINQLSRGYGILSKIFNKQSNYQQALAYKKLYKTYIDSLSNTNKVEELAQMEVSFEYRKKMLSDSLATAQREILLQQKIKEEELVSELQGMGILVFLIVSSFTFLILFKRNTDHKQKLKLQEVEIELTQEKFKKEKLEKENLALSLKSKEQDMSLLATNNALKTKLKGELLIDIQSIVKKSKENTQQLLRSLSLEIKNQIHIEEKYGLWEENIEKANEEFLTNLMKKHPYLSRSEREMSLYIRLNLSAKEIIELKRTSAGSVKVSWHRIRKKLGLTSSEELYAYMKSF